MRGSQSVVVVEHGTLKLQVLLHEWHALRLLFFLGQAWRVFWNTRNLLHEPHVGALLDILVSVDLSLLVGPVWQWCGMCPHSDSCREVNQLEVRGHCLELLVRLAIFESEFKAGIVEAVTLSIFAWDSRKLLVRGVERRRNIVRQKPSISHEVAEANHIAIFHWMTIAFHRHRGYDLPQVVRVVMRVPSNLLALRRHTSVVVA